MTSFDIRGRTGAAWTWFRALPGLIQMAAVVGALLVALWSFGMLDSWWGHVRDWWTDRKVHALQVENNQIRLDNARLEGENAQLAVRVAEKDAEIKALAAEGERQDAAIVETRRKYNQARSGRAPDRAKSWDELDRQLRELEAGSAPHE